MDTANQILEASRLEEGRRRHLCQGQQAAEVRLPDLDQRAAAENPDHHQVDLTVAPQAFSRGTAKRADELAALGAAGTPKNQAILIYL